MSNPCPPSSNYYPYLNAAVIEQPLVIERGVKCGAVFTVVDAANEPIPLDGMDEISASIHEGTLEEPGAVITGGTIDLDNGLTVTDAAGGEVSMNLSKTKTATMPVGEYWQWFYITNSTGTDTAYMPWVRRVIVRETPFS